MRTRIFFAKGRVTYGATHEPKPAKRTLLHGAKSKHNLNPAYTFDNFIIGPNNEFAHAAAAARLKRYPEPIILFLYMEELV